MKVLIVDDNADDRRILKYIVAQKGHEAVEAEDGLEGLRMAKLRRPDLIISDALMPLMDGFQFLRAAKGDDLIRYIPFIFYSSIYKADKDVELAFALGAEAYIVKPKEPAEFWEEVESILQNRKKEQLITTELIKEDEEYLKRYVQVVAAKLEEKVGELEKTLASRTRIEAELKESEERFKCLAGSAQDAIAMIDDDGNVCYWNRAAEKMFGYSLEEIMGKEMHVFLAPPQFREAYRKGLPRFRETGEGPGIGKTLERYALRRDGTEFPVELSLSTVSMQGKWHAIGIIRDITERKRVEESLKHKTEELEEFFSVALDLLCIADIDGRFRRLNLSWEKTLGYSRDELMSKRFFDFIHPDDIAGTRDVLATLASQREVSNFVNRYRSKDGTYRWIEWHVALSGNLIYAAARDITEKKGAEQELHERVAELEKFYDMAVGRELRMKEMKREIERLKNELSAYKKGA